MKMVKTAMVSPRIEECQGIAFILLGSECVSVNSRALVELEPRLLRSIDYSEVGLLIDLCETNYINCKFLNVLIRCHLYAKHTKRVFAVCGVKPLPGEVLAITRLNSLWDMFHSRRQAIEALSRRLGNEVE